jgi:hypothetical protein
MLSSRLRLVRDLITTHPADATAFPESIRARAGMRLGLPSTGL